MRTQKSNQGKIYLAFFLSIIFVGVITPTQAQFKTPTGNVAGTSAAGLSEFQHNTPHGGFKLIRNSSTIMKSEIKFFQQTSQKWAIGIDPNENNTNSFYIYGGNTPDFKMTINPTGMFGLNYTTPTNLLHLKGGDITIEEVAGSPLDGTGPGADLVLIDKDGGKLDIFSDGKTGNICLAGGSSMLQFFRYSTNDYMVVGNLPVPAGNNYRMYVEKGILTEKVKIAVKSDAVNWSDFVFAKDYKLPALSEVEAFVKKNHHLPEIPSAKEVYSEGIDVAQMDAKLLQKIEELTLYMIQLEKNNKELTKRVSDLEKQSK